MSFMKDQFVVHTTVAHSSRALAGAFAALNLVAPMADRDRRRFQLWSADSGVPVLGVRTRVVDVRFPLYANWKDPGPEVREVVTDWKERGYDVPAITLPFEMLNAAMGALEIIKGKPWRADQFQLENPKEVRSTLARWVWPGMSGQDFGLGLGKTWKDNKQPGPGDLIDLHAFDAKREAVLGYAPAYVLPAVGEVVQAVRPGAEVQFSNAQVGGDRVCYFDILCDGELVADGLVDPKLTR